MCYAALLVLFFAPIASGEEVEIVLWNGEKLFDVGEVEELRERGRPPRRLDVVRDEANHTVALSGTIAANAEIIIHL